MADEKSSITTITEVAEHNNVEDAWIIVNGIIWDFSNFALIHPGGEAVIRENAGKDASEVYNDIHGPGLVFESLGKERIIGRLDSRHTGNDEPARILSLSVALNSKVKGNLPDLDNIINVQDFESLAKEHLSERAWAYVSGAANDSYTHSANSEWYRRLFLRPRVLRPTSSVDTSTHILGSRFDVPIFNAPASLSMLTHPQAEVALAKGLSAAGSTIIAPTMASFSLEEISKALPKAHPFFFQLYASQDLSVTKRLIDSARRFGARAILVTVDLPVFSKREANERYEIKAARQKVGAKGSRRVSGKTQARAASNAINPDLTWTDIKWIQEYSGLPVFIKGIQCTEDALKALQCGCAGIYISNHGGRGVDTSQPSLLTLAEIRYRHPEILEQMIVLLDGGIRRGTDILKAICLGATAVCLGRPCFYALMYGQEGVEHLIARTQYPTCSRGLADETSIKRRIRDRDAALWHSKSQGGQLRLAQQYKVIQECPENEGQLVTERF